MDLTVVLRVRPQIHKTIEVASTSIQHNFIRYQKQTVHFRLWCSFVYSIVLLCIIIIASHCFL